MMGTSVAFYWSKQVSRPPSPKGRGMTKKEERNQGKPSLEIIPEYFPGAREKWHLSFDPWHSINPGNVGQMSEENDRGSVSARH